MDTFYEVFTAATWKRIDLDLLQEAMVVLFLHIKFLSEEWVLLHLIVIQIHSLFRKSRPEVFWKMGALRNFAKCTGKRLLPETLLKKRLWYRCFPVNFAKLLRTPFFIEHLWWLLLFIWVIISFPGAAVLRFSSKQTWRPAVL